MTKEGLDQLQQASPEAPQTQPEKQEILPEVTHEQLLQAIENLKAECDALEDEIDLESISTRLGVAENELRIEADSEDLARLQDITQEIEAIRVELDTLMSSDETRFEHNTVRPEFLATKQVEVLTRLLQDPDNYDEREFVKVIGNPEEPGFGIKIFRLLKSHQRELEVVNPVRFQEAIESSYETVFEGDLSDADLEEIINSTTVDSIPKLAQGINILVHRLHLPGRIETFKRLLLKIRARELVFPEDSAPITQSGFSYLTSRFSMSEMKDIGETLNASDLVFDYYKRGAEIAGDEHQIKEVENVFGVELDKSSVLPRKVDAFLEDISKLPRLHLGIEVKTLADYLENTTAEEEVIVAALKNERMFTLLQGGFPNDNMGITYLQKRLSYVDSIMSQLNVPSEWEILFFKNAINIDPWKGIDFITHAEFLSSIYESYKDRPEFLEVIIEFFSQDFADIERIEKRSESSGYMQLYENAAIHPELREITRIRDELLTAGSKDLDNYATKIAGQLLQFEGADRTSKTKDIIDVFKYNHLPLVAKKVKIFSTLYRTTEGYQKLAISPLLEKVKNKPDLFELITFSDLLRSSIDSGSVDLISYMEILAEGEGLLTLLQRGDDLNDLQLKQINNLNQRLQRISGAVFGTSYSTDQSVLFEELRLVLGAKENQTIQERISEMFLTPLGFKSLEDALNASKKMLENASDRNRTLAKDINENGLSVAEGSLQKSFNFEAAAYIFEEGFVASEFLGGRAYHDTFAPLVTDVAMVSGLEELTHAMIETSKWGNITALILPDTNRFSDSPTDLTKPELCYVGERGGVSSVDHYGIRSALGISHVSAFILQGSQKKVPHELEVEMVKKGLYIPILTSDFKIIYTPEQFDVIRTEFAGTKWSDQTIHISPEIFSQGIPAPEFQQGLEKVKTLRDEVQFHLQTWFEDQGIEFSSRFNREDLTKAEIDDTGSTARGTSLPDSFDFDFSLRLTHDDFRRHDDFIRIITESCTCEKSDNYFNAESRQLRLFGVTELFGRKFSEPFDLDINLMRKDAAPLYESHDAVADRLTSIEENYGTEVALKVRNEILTAKKVLKVAGVYKKGSKGEDGQGGLGGIGVENWILSKGQGSFKTACESFLRAATKEDGTTRSFSEFKEYYSILDPGINVIFNSHDDFVKNMTEEGYLKMLEIIRTKV